MRLDSKSLKAVVNNTRKTIIDSIAKRGDANDPAQDKETVDGNETYENEMPDMSKTTETAEDIAKQKQQINNTSIENSTNINGDQQNVNINYNFINNAPDLRDITSTESAAAKKMRTYDLTKPTDFADFVEGNKASEHIAFVIILSVFEHVELDNLHGLKSRLISELPTITDNEGKEIAIMQDPYLSINNLAQVVGGKIFEKTKTGEKCVGLGDGRMEVLNNLWEQFPTLRACISKWLLDVSDTFKFFTNFDMYQIMSAFTSIIKLDFNSGEHHIFERLYSNEKNAWLLGSIAIELYKDENFRERVIKITRKWIASKGHWFWLWKPAYFFHAYVEGFVTNDVIEAELCNTLVHKIDKFLDLRLDIFSVEDLFYINRHLIYSKKARTLITKMLNKLFIKRNGTQDRQLLAELYSIFLQESYWNVSKKNHELPLVVFDDKSQHMDILPLASAALSTYDTKRSLFNILQAYLKELSGYSVSETHVKRLKAYFVLWIEHNAKHAYDICKMLKECKNPLANEILSAIESKNNKVKNGRQKWTIKSSL